MIQKNQITISTFPGTRLGQLILHAIGEMRSRTDARSVATYSIGPFYLVEASTQLPASCEGTFQIMDELTIADTPAESLVGRVTEICEKIGYGRVMQIASETWGEKEGPRRGHHTTGPARALMVPCPALPHDGACDWCCGCGLVTERVALAMLPIPMRLHCPTCHELHVDEPPHDARPHKSHACQSCGCMWSPAAVPTVGVRFLPGYKNEKH